jgi:hypothetical protein
MNDSGDIVESAPLNPEGFEQRLRKVRVAGAVLAVMAMVSLVFGMVVNPVPPLFLAIGAVVGAATGPASALSRKSTLGTGGGLVLGATIALFLNVPYTIFPEMGSDPFTALWPGLSAWALALLVVALPLARWSLERKRPDILVDTETLARFRERGDSSLLAHMRLSAGKTPKVFSIALIVMAAVMEGLGLYVWLVEDDLTGLMLAVMLAPPIALFACMLNLRRQSATR